MIEQQFMGYGILKNGKPTGIWPQSYDWAAQSVTRMRNIKGSETARYEIVPLYVGAPVIPVVLPGINGVSA